MIGVDDTLDEARWRNVQDPIKGMFLAMTKAIRTQAAGIRDLDRKYNDCISHDTARRLIKDCADGSCSKQDATEMLFQIDRRAHEKDVAVLESRLSQATAAIARLEELSHGQAETISVLMARLDKASQDITVLSNPSYETVYAYVDRQITNTVGDTDRKLAAKADTRFVETAVPLRLEDLYRSMNSKLNDLKADVAQCATKEEFHVLSHKKADGTELHAVAQDLADRVTRPELHSAVSSQVKPLITAVASLEKALALSAATTSQTAQAVSEKAQKLDEMYRAQVEREAMQRHPTHAPVNAAGVKRIVEDVISDRRLGEVTQFTVDNSLSLQSDALLRQMGTMGESLRLELVSATREEVISLKAQIDSRISDVAHLAEEISTKHTKTRGAVKELSLNVAKALAKKLDVKEFNTALASVAAREQTAETLAHVVDKALQNHDRNRSSFVRSRAGSPLKQQRDQSSRLMGVQGGRHGSGSSSGASSGESSGLDDVNKEFDYLLRSMREESAGDNNNHDGSGEDGQHHQKQKHPAAGDGGGPGSSPTRFRTARSPLRVNTGDFGGDSAGDDEEREMENMSPLLRYYRRETGNKKHTANAATTPTPIPVSSSSRGSNAASASAAALLVFEKQTNSELRNLRADLSNLKMQVVALSKAQKHHQPNHPSSGEGPGILNTTSNNNINNNNNNNSSYNNSSSYQAHKVDELDWRIALGDLSLKLRSEMAHKASRDELQSVVMTQADGLEQRVGKLQRLVDTLASQEMMQSLSNELTSLRHTVSGEVVGARFLWTSGHLQPNGWVPWDHQVVNASPAVIGWKKGATSVTLRVPGLYRVSVSAFTLQSVVLQVYLNDEPLFSCQPETLSPANHTTGSSNSYRTGGGGGDSAAVYLRRLKHSAGEVSGVTIDEVVSLPPDARLSVRYHSSAAAQAFLSIRKL